MPKLYADVTARRTAQIVADVIVACWVALCIWLGRTVSNGISALRGPVDDLTSAGDSIRDNMAGAADNVGGVPLVGDSLRGPFDAISSIGMAEHVGVALLPTLCRPADYADVAAGMPAHEAIHPRNVGIIRSW